jgi:serine/threonine-protein kinase
MDAVNHHAPPSAGGHGPPLRLGKYELIARIGTGGMAEVYLARLRGPMNFEKIVVVKKIHPHLAREQEFIDMLLDEARISALLKHPRVVDIYDLGVASGTYFIAMEYLPGQPLTKVITKGRRAKPLDVHSSVRLVADAADGLHAAHNLTTISGKHLELVHRDVSPGNIIVTYDGDVKLVDFGVARARGRITNTDVEQIKGKIGYVSPEQINNATVDRRSDIFSLGVVLWEVLTLRRLFYADNEAAKIKMILDGNPQPPSRYRVELPPTLDEICLRALALRPEDRFQTARELQLALEAELRDANYYRESGPVAAFMQATFAREREEQAALLRAVAEATEALELEPSAVEDGWAANDDPSEHSPATPPPRPKPPAAPPRRAFTASTARRAELASQRALAVMKAYGATPSRAPQAEGASSEPAGGAPLADDAPVLAIDEIDIAAGATGATAAARPATASPRPIEPGAHPALIADAEVVGAVAAEDPPSVATDLVAPARVLPPIPRVAWATAGGAAALLLLVIVALGGGDQPSAPPPAVGAATGGTPAPGGASSPSVAEPTPRLPAAAAPTTEPLAAASPVDEPGDAPVADAPVADTHATDALALAGVAPGGGGEDEPGALEPADDRAGSDLPAVDTRTPEQRRADAEAHYRDGVRDYVGGDLAAARRAFRRAIDADSRYAPAYRGIGLVYERQQDAAHALRAYRRYLRLAPDADDAEAIQARIVQLGG